jgi:hypothetical protein
MPSELPMVIAVELAQEPSPVNKGIRALKEEVEVDPQKRLVSTSWEGQ